MRELSTPNSAPAQMHNSGRNTVQVGSAGGNVTVINHHHYHLDGLATQACKQAVRHALNLMRGLEDRQARDDAQGS